MIYNLHDTNTVSQSITNKALSIYKKNQYTQDERRIKVDSGYSDCSSYVQWVYKETLNIDIGINSEEQLSSNIGRILPVPIFLGIPSIKYLQPGDLLYFRADSSKRFKGVGHVEMYIGNNKLIGHGHGVGPSIKYLPLYCLRRRFSRSRSKSLKNHGIICVKRYIDDIIPTQKHTKINAIKQHIRSIIAILKE